MKKPQPLSKPGFRDAGEAGQKIGANNRPHNTKPRTKTHTILTALQRGSLNRFEAERIGDHALNSTVSALRKKGHNISSEWETVPTRFGKPTRLKRYRIESIDHERRGH
ncbi:MAG: helix-turn-helix domain-containing protein [Pseudomonadaceae bacterium]|nr:helix-turn-helix domain-containing protein [Pseudomonadaceae bacterium]